MRRQRHDVAVRNDAVVVHGGSMGPPGTFAGTMSGDDMTFAMDMPSNSMMATGCSSRATGTAHVNRTTMTMTGTYSGSNSCSGAYTSGQMTMTRR